MKKDCWKLIIVVLFVISFISLIFGFIPMVVALITTARILEIDTTNQWISFWGSYLGAIIGSVATIAGVTLTLGYQRQKDIDEERKREHEREEKRRLEVIPYITSNYYIPKTEKVFEENTVYYVDFTVDSPVIRNYMNNILEKLIVKKIGLEQYYVLNYSMRNLGTGSAANLFVSVNGTKIVRNGGLCPNDQMVLNLFFNIEDLKGKRIRIEFDYADVLGKGHYRQEEVLWFETLKDDIILKNEKPLSIPEMIENME